MLICEKKQGVVILKGQQYCLLPLSYGKHTIHIKVTEGELRLNHGCYTSDGGTWLDKPKSDRKSYYDLKNGNEYCLEIDIRISYGKQDRITIVNHQFLKKAEFIYEIDTL